MLITAFTLSVLLMILVPVFLAGLFHRRFQAPWILFMVGTLTFIGSQIVHIPLNNLLVKWQLLPKTGVTDSSISLLQTALILGLTAGLCEETARLIGYWFLKKYRSLEDGIMLGLGHGGVEAMLFGGVLTAATLSSLVPLIGTNLSALNLNPDQLSALTVQLSSISGSPWISAGAPLLERLLAMTLHVTFSVMVLQTFRKHNITYYLAAIVYHMLIDMGAVYAAAKLTNTYLIFPFLFVSILPGMAWLWIQWRKEAKPVSGLHQPLMLELDIFLTALRKEILQQWRTKRFLVVIAVFVLFGLTSPLLAKYTPEIIKSIAGAEQFAGLIPTPTSADAMGQYIKNITQFGFLLAILLGMNAVAGEKESGTAAMILSKPMPRWAFIISKFLAQVIMYASAFLVAGLGAYYYTLLLFGSFDLGIFMAINLLLLTWLITFVAASLLGSVLGSSVAAAAGIGMGFCIALLLAGSIPRYGALFPSGLMAWASMLGTDSTKASANAGALALCFTLIVLFLLWSVAVFEQQEI